MVSQPDKRVDELRQQLKALGYLDAGVDRFVLGSASERRGPIGTALRTSVRVGVLGGALLGPAAALGLGARLPGLVSGPRDAVVLSLYLAVVFCAAAAVVAFLVTAGFAAFARAGADRFAARAQRASRAAAWIVTIATLAYLTLWWRNANAGFGWSAPAWTSFALAVAVTISLLLGHAARIATLAVCAAGGAGAELPAVSSRSWRVVAAGGMLAFAGAAALLVMTAPTEEAAAPDHPAFTVQSRGKRVTLVAIDGFDRNTYVRMRDSLPHLRDVIAWRSTPLAPQDTTDPARAWTTVATGVAPEVHGVHALEMRRVAGIAGVLRGNGAAARVIGSATDAIRLTRPTVASRADRRAKTIWEVAEEAGLRTAVVNWWASWPAPVAGGIVITDRAVLRLDRGGPLDAEIAPAALYERLLAQWPDIRRQAQRDAATAFADSGSEGASEVLRRSAELDGSLVALARTLPIAELDLFVLYLPGLDIAQNTLLGPSAGALAPSDAAARVEALRSYYLFLDRLLGPLLQPAEHRFVMLVTQPGRVEPGAGLLAVGPDYASSNMGGVATHPQDDSGTSSSSPLDVAPTVWRALGVPLSRELAGTPVGRLLGDDPAVADRFIDTYGRPLAGRPLTGGKPLDQETIDRLRSLGYIR